MYIRVKQILEQEKIKRDLIVSIRNWLDGWVVVICKREGKLFLLNIMRAREFKNDDNNNS